MEKMQLSAQVHSLLMVGFLGALTTFSTFSLDTVNLWQNGRQLIALIYVVATVLLSLFAVSIAIWLTRMI
jgi:CrcB protein